MVPDFFSYSVILCNKCKQIWTVSNFIFVQKSGVDWGGGRALFLCIFIYTADHNSKSSKHSATCYQRQSKPLSTITPLNPLPKSLFGDKPQSLWWSCFDHFAKPSPRPIFIFIKVTWQVRLCKVLATWTKLTTDWLVSSSHVTGLLATVHCEADNKRGNCHH